MATMKGTEALKALGDYTADQWGLVTTAQARRAGVNTTTLTRLAQQGLLMRLRYGVYSLTATDTTNIDIKAAWLSLNPATPAWQRLPTDPGGAILSHRTAALLHDLGDIVDEQIEMIVPRRRTHRDPALRLLARELDAEDVTVIDGLPVTTIERTVVDLLDGQVDASHVVPIVHEASRDGRLDLNALAGRIGAYSRRYGLAAGDGHGLLDHLLSHVSDTSPSERVLAEIFSEYPNVHADVLQRLQTAADELSRPNMAPVRRAVNSTARPPRDLDKLLTEFRRIPAENQQAAIMAILYEASRSTGHPGQAKQR